jgi:hypothetical protein
LKKIQVKFTGRILDILLESFFIIVALLLALGLDQWRDEQKELKLAEKMKAAIYAELTSNNERLNDLVIPQKKLFKMIQLRIQQKDDKGSNPEELEFQYTMLNLSNSVWGSAKMTEAFHSFSFDEMRHFSQIYQIEDLILSHQEKLMDEFLGFDNLNEKEKLKSYKRFLFYLNTLIVTNRIHSELLEKIILAGNDSTIMISS